MHRKRKPRIGYGPSGTGAKKRGHKRVFRLRFLMLLRHVRRSFRPSWLVGWFVILSQTMLTEYLKPSSSTGVCLCVCVCLYECDLNSTRPQSTYILAQRGTGGGGESNLFSLRDFMRNHSSAFYPFSLLCVILNC